MVLTNELRKTIEYDIERCKFQIDIAGSEALYNELIAKYTTIDSKFEEGLPHLVKVATLGRDFDYRPEIKAIASKLDMWLKIWGEKSPTPSGPREKVRAFIERGKQMETGEFHLSQVDSVSSFVDGLRHQIWIDEIFMFSVRYLKKHPLYEEIVSTAKRKDNSALTYLNMMGHLEALSADEEFFAEITPTESIAEQNTMPPIFAGNKVFVVHGHDDAAKQEVARALEKADFQAIILHEQPSGGKTIIEKIEANTDVAFAVVLYTPCDLGRGKEQNVEDEQGRARQNVVFEHGYLLGKLGRSRVCALVKDGVETPGDMSGVVYVPMDDKGAWKFELAKEMKATGLNVDANKFL